VQVDVAAPALDHEEGVLALAFQEGHAHFRLQRGLVVDLRLEGRFHHGRSRGEGLVRVALDHRLGVAQVGIFVVNPGRALGQGLFGRAEGRENFVLHLHRLGRGQGLGPGLGQDYGHGVAQLVDLVFAKDGPVRDEVFHAVGALDVLGGHAARHAGHGLGRGTVDGLDPGVGMRAAHGGQFQGAGQADVGREVGHAAGLEHGRGPGVGHAHGRIGEFGPEGVRGFFAPEEPAGQLHRGDDGRIARAAAQVVAQGMLDVFRAGVVVLVQQGLGGHDHARGAEPALDGPGQDKGLLDEVGVVRRAQTLHGDDFGALQVHDLGQAGAHGLAVHDDRAGPALALPVAGLLDAREAEPFPEQVDERHARVGHHLFRQSVDLQSDFFHISSIESGI